MQVLIDWLPTADMWDMHGAGWGWGLLMGAGMIAFWALLIAAVIWLVRGGLPTGPSKEPETPQEALQRRLANGDISVDDYEERYRVITGGAIEPRPD